MNSKLFDFQLIRLNKDIVYAIILKKENECMSRKNCVLKGWFEGKKINLGPDCLYIWGEKDFTKYSISSYTVIDQTERSEYDLWKGMAGMAMFGDGGSVFGIGGKKTKEYLISIEWKDGEKSLILIDEEYYKTFVASMF